MIQAINQSWRKKAFVCILMVIMLVFMQCVCPMLEAHAVAIAVGAVAAAAIAALLVMIGVKIMPTTTTSLSTIYSNLVRCINEGGESAYPNLLNLLGTLATTGVKIGDTIKILGTKLGLIKTELLKALNISGAYTDMPYDSSNISIADLNIYNESKLIYYQGSYTNTENELQLPFGVNQVSLLNNRFFYKNGNGIPIGVSTLRIKFFENGIDNLSVQVTAYGKKYMGINNGVVSYENTTETETYSWSFDPTTYPNYNGNVKVVIRYGEAGLAYTNGDIIGKSTDQVLNVRLKIGDVYTNGYIIFSGSGRYPIQGEKNASYTITATELVPDNTQTVAKVIPGVADATIGVANGKTDGIDVTLPNTLTPTMDSICPDAKDKLDTLNPSIDYDDITTHTWDDATDSELPDTPDGTIDGTDEGTGEIDLGEIKDMPDENDLKLPEIITDKFPFSIPWDVVRAVKCLVATPEVPHWTIPFKIDSMGFEYDMEISMEQFEPVAAVCRWFTTVIVVIGLIMATRKLIGQ